MLRESASGQIMSNDLLPSPDILADPPEATGAARGGREGMTNGIGGSALTHYPAGGPQSQTNGAGHAFSHADASMSHDPPVPKAAADSLAEVMATVRQVGSMLQANGALAADVHFAVERIHDVAMALRMREVDAALCDTLEASIREVGDAIVGTDAAAARALSAAALLSELARRVDQIIPRSPAPPAAIEPAAPAPLVAAGATAVSSAGAVNDASLPPLAHAVDDVASDADDARLPLQAAFLDQSFPESPRHHEMQTMVEPKEDVSQSETSAELPLLQSAFLHPILPGMANLPEMHGLVGANQISDEIAAPAATTAAAVLQLSQPAFVHSHSPETSSLPQMQVLVETEEFSDETETSAMPLSQSAFPHPSSTDTPSPPEEQALVEATDDSGESAETVAHFVASSLDENEDAAFQASNQDAHAATNPGAQADGQGAGSLREIVASEMTAPGSTAPDDAQSPPPVATSLSPTGTDPAAVAEPAAALASRGAVAADPLAPLYALSEEELIALFS
jgi:hypothetical protein